MGSPLGKIDQQDHAIYEQTRWGIGVVRIILQQEKGVFSPSQKRWWLFSSNKMGGHEFTIILEVWQEHWDLYNYQTSVIAVWLSWWLGLVSLTQLRGKRFLTGGIFIKFMIHSDEETGKILRCSLCRTLKSTMGVLEVNMTIGKLERPFQLPDARDSATKYCR